MRKLEGRRIRRHNALVGNFNKINGQLEKLALVKTLLYNRRTKSLAIVSDWPNENGSTYDLLESISN